MDAGFQARGSLRGGRKATQSKHREDSGDWHALCIHDNEDTASSGATCRYCNPVDGWAVSARNVRSLGLS
jgi:hypothetical protein